MGWSEAVFLSLPITRKYWIMIKAVIFDMDGVMADNNEYHKKALQEFCATHGYSLSEEELRKNIYGRANKDWLTNLFGELPEDKIQQYAHEKEALYRKIYAADIKPVPGLIEFLHHLQSEKIPMAIATSAPRVNVDFTLKGIGAEGLFPIIVDDSFVKKGKPDPEVYLTTARLLGHDPGDCLIFEDSLSGIRSGLDAGSKVAAITTTHTNEEVSHAHLIMEDFKGWTWERLINGVS